LGFDFRVLGAAVAVGTFGGISVHFLIVSSFGLVAGNPVEAESALHTTICIYIYHNIPVGVIVPLGVTVSLGVAVPLGLAHRDVASPPAAFGRELEGT
jgi:hypothetical protein